MRDLRCPPFENGIFAFLCDTLFGWSADYTQEIPQEINAKKIVYFHGNLAIGVSRWVLGVG